MIIVLRFFIRIALRVFCREIRIKNLEITKDHGPLLLLANHPDSFLDAIILGAIYDRKIHFLARGDVFRNPVFGYLLRSIGMIPIFRAREGKEHLHKNASTFDESVQIIQNGGAVLIFIEGLCLNTNTLLPFKKGASRIVEQLQAKHQDFQIHIATLAYNNFHSMGKTVEVAFERLATIPQINEAKDRTFFNELVRENMHKHEIETVTPSKRMFPKWAYIGKPLYKLVDRYVDKKTNGTVFYDSVLFAVLFFTFPLYLGAIMIGLFSFFYWFLLIFW